MAYIPLITGSQSLSFFWVNTTYHLDILWRDGVYTMNLYDKNKNPLLLGISIVKSDDITKQLSYLQLPSFEVINSQLKTDPNYFDIDNYVTNFRLNIF